MFQLRTSASQLIGHVRRCGNQGMTLPVSARSYSVGEDNPYFAKYASKLKKLEEQNPEEFLYRVKEAGRKHRKKIIVNADGTVPEDDGILNSEAIPRQTREPLHVEEPGELEKLSLADLTDVWKRRHLNKDAICGVVPVDMFETMAKRGLEFPLFVYPVPRGDGYEMYFGQVASGGLEVHFTPLAEYHRHQSEAPASLRLKFFSDFKKKHGVILMAGEYNGEVIGPEHAQCLANQHQIYYGSSELKRKLLLWNFNREPKSFNYEVLIDEFDKTLGKLQEGQIIN
ncbi:ATP synthase mitochondrial F1 complex assembly factor 1-like isoform X1 [Varroa jacobsoni]|uniref:ATP synthase mitochondrial F1 complex assembly factor 1-like isoform X1 n=2 Tax=Varroa jacobsoni TaxID=62625 RepID=UPI000BF6835D|nr:ATP synthase mitochondrial F1 complex assembly factor 1-like isoform X1 [Varroa jacobsoni]